MLRRCSLQWVFIATLLSAAACRQLPPAPPPDGQLLTLFPANNRWGYLDSTGTVVLPPRYHAAQPFAEGLAAVREHGLYGYIDAAGRYVLPPAYEYATPFVGGGAVVWEAGHPWLIDRTGRTLTPIGRYKELVWQATEPGQPPRLLALSRSGRAGVLNARGQLVLDTVYSSVDYLGLGYFAVRRPVARLAPPPADRASGADASGLAEESDLAIVDCHGQPLVPTGRYKQVLPFTDGLAVAHLPESGPNGDYSDAHLLDARGQVLGTISGKRYSTYDAQFHDGVLVIDRRRPGPDALNEEYYPAVLDRRGRELYADTALKSISPYYHGRAWAETQTGQYYLIDHTGRRLHQRGFGQPVGPNFANLVPPTFRHGFEVVRVDSGRVQLVDSTGRVRGPARRLPFAYDDVLGSDGLLDFSRFIRFPDGSSTTRHGLWDVRTGLLLSPRFGQFGDDFQRGLLPVTLNGRSAYLDRAGRLAWLAATTPPPAARRNCDQLSRATYRVASPRVATQRGLGGWAPSGNLPRRLPGAPTARGQLRVAVAAEVADTIVAHQFAGHWLTISNATPDTVLFDGQDSMLDLVLEARDPAGRWQAIEYLPHSFCGNSYHSLFLAPGQYWRVAVPAYAGSQPTTLRARLTPRRWPPQGKPRVWYSNEFAGSVNPGQFWRQRQPRFSDDIMNPYLD